MITTEDILKNIPVSIDDNNDEWYLENKVKIAMVDYATEVLKEAANRAEIAEDVTNDNDYSDDEQELNEEGRRIIVHGGGHINGNYVEVDKNSILNIINELK
jgi:hypothetical protein